MKPETYKAGTGFFCRVGDPRNGENHYDILSPAQKVIARVDFSQRGDKEAMRDAIVFNLLHNMNNPQVPPRAAQRDEFQAPLEEALARPHRPSPDNSFSFQEGPGKTATINFKPRGMGHVPVATVIFLDRETRRRIVDALPETVKQMTTARGGSNGVQYMAGLGLINLRM